MMTRAFSVTSPVLLGCYHSKSLYIPPQSDSKPSVIKTALGDEVILHTSENNDTESKASESHCFSNGKYDVTDRQELNATNSEGSRQIDVSEGSRKKDGMPLSEIDPSLNRDWLNFPFFTHKNTVRYLSKQKTKIMFIMRGLSGSGKSSVVSILKETYSDAVTCSADDYFRSEDGSYAFDGDKLGNAHGYSQNQAKTACHEGKSIIIVDNTNVKRWEMKVYLLAAKQNGYVVVLVEPKTDWKFNPEELARRNKHGVPLDVLQRKVSTFDHITPLYYGWFLAHSKSETLKSFGLSVFSECLDHFTEFQKELLTELRVGSHHISTDIAKEILLDFYTDGGKTSPLLHCTSCFCGGGKVSGGKHYHQRKDVQACCGQVFQLTLTGLVMTRRTFGVRVLLDENSLSLFERPEESKWTGDSTPLFLKSSSSLSSLPSTSSDKKPKSQQKLSKKKKRLLAQEKKLMQSNDTESDHDEPKPSLSLSELINDRIDRKKYSESVDDGELTEPLVQAGEQGDVFSESETDINTIFPQIKNSGIGKCAHLTLKTARNVESKQTNYDILQACDIEKSRQFKSVEFFPVSKGKALYLGQGICCVYFDQPIKVNAIFSGYF